MKSPVTVGADHTIRRLVSGFMTNLETITAPVLQVIFFAFIVAVIVILYLTGASRVAATGYDIRDLEQRRVRLEREEQRLLNRASELQAFTRIDRDATTRLGLIPATSPDYVRSRPSPIDIDQRLRNAQARTHLENLSVLDALRVALHLPGVSEEPLLVKQPETKVDLSVEEIWNALTGNIDQMRNRPPPLNAGDVPMRRAQP